LKYELVKIYAEADNSVADEIAISRGEKVYIIDSGKENGKINFGVREIVSISDSKLRAEFIRRRNNESLSKGYISDGLSSKFGGRYDNDRPGDRRSKTGPELQDDNGKSQNNQRGIPSNSGNIGGLNRSGSKSGDNREAGAFKSKRAYPRRVSPFSFGRRNKVVS
jgi:hypothetical protein